MSGSPRDRRGCCMRHREGLQGTCGWTSPTLQSGRFYPGNISGTAPAGRPCFYSRAGGFGVVEVDTSTYAIPSPTSVQKWAAATPRDFQFHSKRLGRSRRKVLHPVSACTVPTRRHHLRHFRASTTST